MQEMKCIIVAGGNGNIGIIVEMQVRNSCTVSSVPVASGIGITVEQVVSQKMQAGTKQAGRNARYQNR